MSEVTDLTVIEIKPEQAPVLYVAGGLDAYLEQIRQAVNEVPDLSTKKGRDRVASLAAQVSRSKTAIEKPGREYLKRLKEAVRPAEAEIKRFVDACDELRDATRRPLTAWEAEQERIKAEEVMNAMHAEALEMNEEFDRQRAAQIEADHEMALLMNDAFDRDREEKRRQKNRLSVSTKSASSWKRQSRPVAMPKRSTKRRLKLQRDVKLKRKLALNWRNASALKRNSVRHVRSRKRKLGQNAKKLRQWKPSALRQSRQKMLVWPKRSAKSTSRQSEKLT